MDTIFIDTSVFISNNYLDSASIRQILKWGQQGYIRILMPEITYQELKKNAHEAIQKALAVRDKTIVLRNIPSVKPALKLFDREKLPKEFIEELDKNLNKAKCISIGYLTLDTSIILRNYFDNKPPFHTKDKKSEFPDALTIATIEKWCIENKCTCIVFTTDKGMEACINKVIKHESLPKYLDEKLRSLEKRNLEKAQELYKEKEGELLKQIEDWVHLHLDDNSFYNDYLNSFEVHNVEIENITVDLLGYSFTSVTDPYITFHSNARIKYKVNVEVDDESDGYYDSEDKEWISLGTKTETIEEQLVVPIEMRIDIPEAGEDYMAIEIYEINHNKALPSPTNSEF